MSLGTGFTQKLYFLRRNELPKQFSGFLDFNENTVASFAR